MTSPLIRPRLKKHSGIGSSRHFILARIRIVVSIREQIPYTARHRRARNNEDTSPPHITHNDHVSNSVCCTLRPAVAQPPCCQDQCWLSATFMRAGVKTDTLLFIGEECHTTASVPGIAAPDRTPWRQHGNAKSDRDTGEQPPGRAAIMAGVADKSLHDTPKPSNDQRVCCSCEVTGLRP